MVCLNALGFVCIWYFCRRGHDVLSTQLPIKEEHVILVRLSPLQRALYKEFMNRFREAGNSGWLGLNPLKAFCVCCKVTISSSSSCCFTGFKINRLLPDFNVSFRYGTILTFCMKLCRRRTWPTSRTWILMT